MPEAREKTFTLRWGNLAAKCWGPSDGVRVLALHGWLDNAASFDRLAPLLPHCQIVAVEFAGAWRADRRLHCRWPCRGRIQAR